MASRECMRQDPHTLRCLTQHYNRKKKRRRRRRKRRRRRRSGEGGGGGGGGGREEEEDRQKRKAVILWVVSCWFYFDRFQGMQAGVVSDKPWNFTLYSISTLVWWCWLHTSCSHKFFTYMYSLQHFKENLLLCEYKPHPPHVCLFCIKYSMLKKKPDRSCNFF